MDTLERYRQIIRKILTDHARIPYSHGQIESQTVFDPEGDHYLLMVVGRDKRRMHACIVHVDIIDGKFWIQYDGTEYGVAKELQDAGVPKDHIVLAFHAPDVRTLSGYALA